MSALHQALRCALLLLCALGAAGCRSPDADPAEAPRSVRYYLSSYPASLSMLGKTDANAEIVAVQLTDSLVQYDPALTLQPRLAESWEFSADRRTLTFQLRPGVRWHDGRPLRADDVVFSVRKVLEPAVEDTVWAPLFHDLESVDAPDDRTVRARYTRASPDALEAWRLPILPRHAAGADPDLLTGAFARHPIGCGPFRFVSAIPDREIVLEANDDYWDGRPAFDRLVLRVFTDQRTAYQALLTGELDVMKASSNLLDQARRKERARHLDSLLLHRFSAWIVGWNQDGSNPFFTDARVRRALVLALDRPTFVDKVILGLARVGATTYHPDTVWADPGVEPLPFDPARAARLLEQAGWIDADGDGVRERAGRPLRFTLMIPASNQNLNDLMAAWQQESWAAVGVEARIEKLEWQAFRERRNAGVFEAAAYALLFGPTPDQFELYHSSSRAEGANYFGIADPEIDRWLERGRSTFDPQQRREVYHALQRRLLDEQPLSCLFYFSSPVLFQRNLHGLESSPLGLATTSRGPRVWHWVGPRLGG